MYCMFGARPMMYRSDALSVTKTVSNYLHYNWLLVSFQHLVLTTQNNILWILHAQV